MPSALRQKAKRAAVKARRRAPLLLENPMARVKLKAWLLEPYWRMRFRSFGRRAVVLRPHWLYGARAIAVGEQAFIFPAWISVEKSAWDGPEPALQIGARTTIAPGCLIGVKESVLIGEDVSIGAYSLVVDCEHQINGPHESLAHNPLEARPVRIGRGSSIGGRSAVLWGSTIGRYCLVGSNSVVHGDIPDYAIAVGAPARVIGWTRDAEGNPLGTRGSRERAAS